MADQYKVIEVNRAIHGPALEKELNDAAMEGYGWVESIVRPGNSDVILVVMVRTTA